jgi:pyruvate formate lyase activating enzyme
MAGNRGFISKVQRYSTKDGPGIRSTVFFKGCNLRCLWCANPELIDGSCPALLYHREKCVRCGSCAAVSGGSVRMGPEGCEIDRKRCTDEEACADACSRDAWELLGTRVTAPELAETLLRDADFYRQSGGGVTFSGGEPALQADFVAETAALLKDRGIHTALDTAGSVPWETLEKAAEKTDLVLYDIKAYDESVHRRCTGFSNTLILENIRRLAEGGKRLCVRLVLAPRYNDGADLEARLGFVKSLGAAVLKTDILPLHRLAAGKYRALDIPDPLEGVPECPAEALREAAETAGKMGLPIRLGG